jgi:c(7)-type cytochrome triheme protein
MLVLAGVLLAAGLAGAQGLPKLPADLTLQQTGDSPGKVVFSHASHLGMQSQADCTACHPKLAPILKAKARSRQAITHERMTKGQSCGACHNGTAARGFDDCTMCHHPE